MNGRLIGNVRDIEYGKHIVCPAYGAIIKGRKRTGSVCVARVLIFYSEF